MMNKASKKIALRPNASGLIFSHPLLSMGSDRILFGAKLHNVLEEGVNHYLGK